MKAQVFYEPNKMELTEVPDPKPAADQVLVRVKACGICGSDVAYFFGDASLETETGKGPLILGHEFTGEVVEVGEAAKNLFSPGDRVVLDPVQYCNACEICKRGYPNLCENKAVLGVSTDGGFAEYALSSYTGVHKLPENVTYEQGALTEPLACATYGIQNLNILPGSFCVVIGAGPIGLMMVQLAKANGAGTVALVERLDYRLETGKQLGADMIFNTGESDSPHYCEDLTQAIADATQGKMADRVIVATGAVEAMQQALDISGRRSTIVYFGLPGDQDVITVPALQSILWDKTIRFSWLAPHTWPAALSALASGQVNVDPLITGEVPLEGLEQALADVRDRKGNPFKVLVKP